MRGLFFWVLLLGFLQFSVWAVATGKSTGVCCAIFVLSSRGNFCVGRWARAVFCLDHVGFCLSGGMQGKGFVEIVRLIFICLALLVLRVFSVVRWGFAFFRSPQ
jgi:hypothetical protein